MTIDGAHWVRAALQVNPYAYEGRNAPKNFFTNEEVYNEALLDECRRFRSRVQFHAIAAHDQRR